LLPRRQLSRFPTASTSGFSFATPTLAPHGTYSLTPLALAAQPA
jgi:hypothetical protein